MYIQNLLLSVGHFLTFWAIKLMSTKKKQGTIITLSPLGFKNIAHKEGSDPQGPLIWFHYLIPNVIVNYSKVFK